MTLEAAVSTHLKLQDRSLWPKLPEMMYGQILGAGAKPPGEAASIRSCLQAGSRQGALHY